MARFDQDLEERVRRLERRLAEGAAVDDRLPAWQRPLKVNRLDFPATSEAGSDSTIDPTALAAALAKILFFRSTLDPVTARSTGAAVLRRSAC